MSVLFLVATVLATSPTDAWIESSKAEFKLADLSLEANEEGDCAPGTSPRFIITTSHDHLLASFFATLGKNSSQIKIRRYGLKTRMVILGGTTPGA